MAFYTAAQIQTPGQTGDMRRLPLNDITLTRYQCGSQCQCEELLQILTANCVDVNYLNVFFFSYFNNKYFYFSVAKETRKIFLPAHSLIDSITRPNYLYLNFRLVRLSEECSVEICKTPVWIFHLLLLKRLHRVSL